MKTHREIISRAREALRHKMLSLILVFPTISLLEYVQDELLGEPDIHGCGGIRFLLFEGFINEIGTQLGLNIKKPSLAVKNFLVDRCFRELDNAGGLPFLRQIPFNKAFRDAFLGGIAEWKRSGLGADLLMEWALEKGEKEQELALLYRRYQDLLQDYGFIEEDQLLDQIENFFLDNAAESYQFIPYDVILYGFHDLTPLQNDFIKALKPWCRFEAMVDPTKAPDFQAFTSRCFALEMGYPAAPLDAAPQNALHILQRDLWVNNPHPVPLAPADESVKLLQSAGSYRETVGIARAIRKWYPSVSGFTWDKVLIITPEPQEFILKAKPIFDEYQLPLTEAAAPAREFPSINRMTRSLQVVAADWQWQDVIPFLKAALEANDIQGIDRFIDFLSERYGAVAGRKRWLALTEAINPAESPIDIRLAFECFQKAIFSLAALPEQGATEIFLRLTYNYLSEEVRQQLNYHVINGISPDLEQRYFRNIQATQQLLQMIEDILVYPELIGNPQPLSAQQYLDFFKERLLDWELEPLPSRKPSIRVIHPREARGIRSELVFITGLEQGHFPRSYINDWKIGLKARLELKALGIELETGEQYLIQEKLAFYWALQTATEKLYLVCQEQDENGQLQNRSPFLAEILECFPELAQRAIRYPLSPTLPPLTDCYSDKEIEYRMALELMLPQNRRQAAGAVTQTGGEMVPPTLADDRNEYLALLQQPRYQKLTFQIHEWIQRTTVSGSSMFRHPDSLHYLNRIFGPRAIFPVTSLEDYLHCPMRFYLKNILKIKPLARPVLRPGGLDLGILYHQVLCDFGDCHRHQPFQTNLAAILETDLRKLFDHHFQDWRDKAANDLEMLFLEIQGERIWQTLRKWLRAELVWADQTENRFRFSFLEFAFGILKGDFDPDSLETPFVLTTATDRIRIAGKIDRVDTDQKGRFIVYDYKMGTGPAGKDLLNLKQLQIPIYLMALEQLKFGPDQGIGGSYLGLANPNRWSGGIWRAAELPPRRESQTLLEAEDWNQWRENVRHCVVETVAAIRSGHFAKVAEDCMSYCEYRQSCRRQDWEVDPHGELAAESGAE